MQYLVPLAPDVKKLYLFHCTVDGIDDMLRRTAMSHRSGL